MAPGAQEFYRQAIQRSTGAKALVKIRQSNKTYAGSVVRTDPDLYISLSEDDPLPDKAWVEVKIHSDTGIYSFSGLASKYGEGILRMALPSDVAVFQRRRFIRLKIDVPVEIKLLRYGNSDLSQVKKIATGKATDLSPGGTAIMTNLKLPQGMQVGVTFKEAPWLQLGELKGFVRRITEAEEGSFLLGIEFSFTSKVEKDKLLQLVVSAFREKRRGNMS